MPLDELPDLLAYLVRFRWWQTLGAATTLVVVVMAALLAVRAMVRAGRARRSIRRSVSNPVLAGAGMDRRAKHWFAFSKKVVKTAVLAFCGWASWVQCNDIRNGWLLHRMQATLDAIDLDLARLRAHTEDPPSEARLRISLGTEGRTASKDTFDTDWADAHAYAYYGQLIKDVDRLDRSVHAPRLLDEIEVTTGEFRAIRGRERDAYLRAGDFLLDSDQTDKAKDLYLRCLAIEPENRHAWEKLADCEVDLGHPERAVDALTKLLSTPAMRDAPSAARARTLHRRGSARLLLATDSKKLRATIDDLDAAILAMMRPPVADDAAAPAEELVRCLLDRGLASYFLGDARRAVADCHRAVALTAQLGADSGTKTQVLRSLSRGYRGIVSSVPDFDREAALADLNDAIVRLGSQQSGGDPRLERDYAIFLIARGEMLLVGMDRATEADRSFAAGIAATTDPSTRRFSGDSVHMGYLARAYQGRARILRHQGRLIEAVEACNKAIKLYDRLYMRHGWWDFSAWGERAEIEFDMKDFKSAIQSSNRAIYYHCDRYRATKSPDHFVEMLQYLKLRGNASQFLGDFPSTIRDWEWMIAAIEQAADAGDASRWKDLYASVLNNLSLAYGRSRSPEHGPRRGIQLATRANNLTQGGHPEILDTLAELHARLGDFPAAIRHEEEAIKLLDAKHQDAGRGEQFRLRLDRYRKGCLPPEG